MHIETMALTGSDVQGRKKKPRGSGVRKGPTPVTLNLDYSLVKTLWPDVHRYVLYETRPGHTHTLKTPLTLDGRYAIDHSDPDKLVSKDVAIAAAQRLGLGVGFVLREEDGYFCLDIDTDKGQADWSPLTKELCTLFKGCYQEVSFSGRGIHIFGRATSEIHSEARAKKNTQLHLELYDWGRYIALTGYSAQGSFEKEVTPEFNVLVRKYFLGGTERLDVGWTDLPCVDGPPVTLEAVLEAAITEVENPLYPGKPTFSQLWLAEDVGVLSARWPSSSGDQFDRSSADQALANKLAFYTGGNCQLMLEAMLASGLNRVSSGAPNGSKWEGGEESSYLRRTILKACERQLHEGKYYGVRATRESEPASAFWSSAPCDGWMGETDDDLLIADMREADRGARSKISFHALFEGEHEPLCRYFPGEELGTINYKTAAHNLAARFLVTTGGDCERVLRLLERSKLVLDGLDLRGIILGEATRSQPRVSIAPNARGKMFEGCTLITSPPSLLTPLGSVLTPSETNVAFSGKGRFVVGITSEGGARFVDTAWEYLTKAEPDFAIKSRAHRVHYDPSLPFGHLDYELGISRINAMREPQRAVIPGDMTPFNTHLEKLIPDVNDRMVLWYWMCGVARYPGKLARWAPVIQGLPGNGKSLIGCVLAYAVGTDRTFPATSGSLYSKFNSWMQGRLLITVNEFYAAKEQEEYDRFTQRITEADQELEGKGVNQKRMRNMCNYMLFANPEDAVRKTRGDRRFAVFYTDQQREGDLERAGLTAEYFRDLWGWLENEQGYAHVAYHLLTCEIPDAYDFTKLATRAPVTTSLERAISESRNPAEQAILEAVDEGRLGFRGGWISSVQLTKLLEELKLAKWAPLNRRRSLLRDLGYVPHPTLKDGRSQRSVAIDGALKPRLYIREVDGPKLLGDPIEAYVKAQEQG